MRPPLAAARSSLSLFTRNAAMPCRRRRRPWLLGMLVLVLTAAPTAAAEIPDGLPRYDLDMHLDVANHQVRVRQRVTWTNRHDRVAAELVFSVHSHFKLPSKDIGFTAKMLEILRVTPSDAIDALGRACEIQRVTLLDTALSDSAGPAGQVLSPHWDNAQLPQDPKAASDPQV